MVDSHVDALWAKHQAAKTSLRARVKRRTTAWARTPRDMIGCHLGSRLGTVASDASSIRVVSRLRRDDLMRLYNGTYCAIHVPGFASSEEARVHAEAALNPEALEAWAIRAGEETDVFYPDNSVPLQVALSTRSEFERYFRHAESFLEAQRAAVQTGPWVIDRLRCTFDESWPWGSHLGFPGRPYLPWVRPTVIRVMSPDARRSPHPFGFIHTDDVDHMGGRFRILSANIYLKVAEVGGEFLVWPVHLTKGLNVLRFPANAYVRALLSMAFDDDVQEELLRMLPEPLTIRPAPGDLVILDTGRPHSVSIVSKGVRASYQSFFMTEANRERPLSMFG
jgi:hypothetical protein